MTSVLCLLPGAQICSPFSIRSGQPFVSWMPGGVWVKSHIHFQPARVAVLDGSPKPGFDSRFDKSATPTISNGSFLTVSANESKVEGSGGERLVIVTALGNCSKPELP
ncbi:MAG: hypothetical protein K7J46_13500 [Bryobacter sp.]|nr:hypothetical protein [Bryobacter sp. CoA8 C33]